MGPRLTRLYMIGYASCIAFEIKTFLLIDASFCRFHGAAGLARGGVTMRGDCGATTARGEAASPAGEGDCKRGGVTARALARRTTTGLLAGVACAQRAKRERA